MNNNIPVVQGYAVNQNYANATQAPLVEDYGDNFNGKLRRLLICSFWMLIVRYATLQ